MTEILKDVQAGTGDAYQSRVQSGGLEHSSNPEFHDPKDGMHSLPPHL